ncbi:MAG: hypothetical protein SFV15_16525 [Polyangiaceae bacterium]|nr:hypothetical protein [Polyangiaceae bacterium]
MPSRLRRTSKSHPTKMAEWLKNRALSLRVALESVDRAYEEHVREMRKLHVNVMHQFRSQGLLVEDPVNGLGFRVGDVVESLPSLRPARVSTRRPVFEAVSRAIAELTALAGEVRDLPVLFPGSVKIRNKRRGAKERTRVEPSLQELVKSLVAEGKVPFLTPRAQRQAHRDPNLVRFIASHHLHTGPSANCASGDRCRDLAVSRALDHLLDGVDSPGMVEVRRLATELFVVGGALEAAAARVDVREPAAVEVRCRCLSISRRLYRLDNRLRETLLTAPYDRGARGERPTQGLIVGATLHLDDGDFPEAWIGSVLDDGMSQQCVDDAAQRKEVKKRTRRVSERLRAHLIPSGESRTVEGRVNQRTVHARDATSAQVAYAQQHPTLEWKNGRAYRWVGSAGAPPFLEPDCTV